MPKAKPLPRGADFRKEWDRLDRDGRRRVRQAANRGEAAGTKREASLAAAMAVNQQRMWRWAWLIAPVVVAALRWPDGWLVMLANFGVGLVIFGLMALFFYRRAQRAERANREVLAGKRKPPGPKKR